MLLLRWFFVLVLTSSTALASSSNSNLPAPAAPALGLGMSLPQTASPVLETAIVLNPSIAEEQPVAANPFPHAPPVASATPASSGGQALLKRMVFKPLGILKVEHRKRPFRRNPGLYFLLIGGILLVIAAPLFLLAPTLNLTTGLTQLFFGVMIFSLILVLIGVFVTTHRNRRQLIPD